MMIQDIGNHIFHNEFDNKEVTEDDIVFVFYGNQILCKLGDNKELILPTFKQLNREKEEVVFAFHIDEKPYFLLRDWDGVLLDGFTYQSVEILRNVTPKHESICRFLCISFIMLVQGYEILRKMWTYTCA